MSIKNNVGYDLLFIIISLGSISNIHDESTRSGDPQSIAAPATKCDIAALVNVIPGLLY